jgi:hypothetical protein
VRDFIRQFRGLKATETAAAICDLMVRQARPAQHGPGPITGSEARLAIDSSELVLDRREDAGDQRCRAQAQPAPDLAAALGGAHVRRKRDGFRQQLRFRQLVQRQPDGAFVLAQLAGDLDDGCLAVALAPDPRGKLVQAARGRAAAVIDQRFASISRTINRSVFAFGKGKSVTALSVRALSHGAGAEAGPRSPACRRAILSAPRSHHA